MATLQSKIRLCKGIKMDREYNNVLNLSESDMLSLCESSSHLVASANDYSFIRNKGTISTNFRYGDALQSNYIAFQNKDYSNKWFFAWIDEVIYNGENNTEIKYTIDEFSTWFSKITPKACYVEREHVNDDTIGANIVDEDLDIGEVICETETTTLLNQNLLFVIECAVDITDGGTGSWATLLNNGVMANNIYLFSYNSNMTDEEKLDFWENIINFFWILTSYDKTIDDVKNFYVIPRATFTDNGITWMSVTRTWGETTHEISYGVPNDLFEIAKRGANVTKLSSFTGVQVKNNKCFTSPYNYLLVTNNNGNQNIYSYEYFLNSTHCTFDMYLSHQIGGSCRLVPYDYKCKLGVQVKNNFDESLPLGKYPTFNFSDDAYTNWLTANGVNVISSVFNTFTSAVSNIGGLTQGGIPSTLSDVANNISQFKKANMIPALQGGQNTSDVMYASFNNEFVFKKMRCDDEHMRMIDNYFSRFGYKILETKVPNINGRTNFNFVKIFSSEEIGYGDVPSKSLETINKAFRKGITIWHNHTNLGDFSVTNTIVS